MDKSSLKIVIAIKLWKKKALGARAIRNEPVRKLIVETERQLSIELPFSIQLNIISDALKITKDYKRLYVNYLGKQNPKTICAQEHIHTLSEKLLHPVEGVEMDEKESNMSPFNKSKIYPMNI